MLRKQVVPKAAAHLQAGVGRQGLLAQKPLRLAVELLDELACRCTAAALTSADFDYVREHASCHQLAPKPQNTHARGQHGHA